MRYGDKAKLADKAGVPRPKLSMILNDRRRCQWQEAKKLARVSGVPPSVWMDGPGARIIEQIDQAAALGKGILAASRNEPLEAAVFVPNPETVGDGPHL